MESYIKIPDTDLFLFKIGFGTANAGLDWDQKAADTILENYVSLGGNFIDTARIYSDWVAPEIGRSERVIGDWIRRRGRHDDVVILTKCGHPQLDSMHTSRLSKKDVEYDIDLSLKALGVNTIDIYCFHRDDESRSVEELVETMEELVTKGKIRYYACSNWSVDRISAADAYCKKKGYRGFVLNEILYNIGVKNMKPYPDDTMCSMNQVFSDYHQANPRNLLVPYMSICSGFFHAAETKGLERMESSPYYTPENLLLYHKLMQARKDTGLSITQLLLGFYAFQKYPCLPLASSANTAQLAEIMGSASIDYQKDYPDLKKDLFEVSSY